MDEVGWARVGLADADDDADDDAELAADVDDALVRPAVAEAVDGELPAVDVAGALVGAVDGVGGAAVLLAEPSVSVPSVVVSDEWEAPTSADTGR